MFVSEAAKEARARRAAKRVGLLAMKSRRSRDVNNLGGFRLIDPERNAVMAGERCDLSAEDVIEMCS